MAIKNSQHQALLHLYELSLTYNSIVFPVQPRDMDLKTATKYVLLWFHPHLNIMFFHLFCVGAEQRTLQRHVTNIEISNLYSKSKVI